MKASVETMIEAASPTGHSSYDQAKLFGWSCDVNRLMERNCDPDKGRSSRAPRFRRHGERCRPRSFCPGACFGDALVWSRSSSANSGSCRLSVVFSYPCRSVPSVVKLFCVIHWQVREMSPWNAIVRSQLQINCRSVATIIAPQRDFPFVLDDFSCINQAQPSFSCHLTYVSCFLYPADLRPTWRMHLQFPLSALFLGQIGSAVCIG